jgi:Fe-S-cluster containining protein
VDDPRQHLVDHVLETQRTVRSCTGCGLCCTAAYNTVRILPIEAARIAQHVGGLEVGRRRLLIARLRATVARFALGTGSRPKLYTCSFLEPDQTCALPFDVKPVACLAFNPIHDDRCEMDDVRFFAAHDPIEKANGQQGWPDRRSPIPVAVLSVLDDTKTLSPRPRRGRPRRAPRRSP